MLENLDRAKARDSRRFAKSIMDPVVVQSVRDIKRIVTDLDPKKNPESHDIEISTTMQADVSDEEGNLRKETYEVRANTKSKTKRDMLVEGLIVIQRRVELAKELKKDGETIEIDGMNMRPIPVGCGVEGRSWVDPLISQWTGGFRVGIDICWDLDEYRYKYDIFEHRLTRVRRNETGSAATSSV